MLYQVLPLPAQDYDEIIMAVWEAAVRATYDFLAEEDLQLYKKAIGRNVYLQAC